MSTTFALILTNAPMAAPAIIRSVAQPIDPGAALLFERWWRLLYATPGQPKENILPMYNVSSPEFPNPVLVEAPDLHSARIQGILLVIYRAIAVALDSDLRVAECDDEGSEAESFVRWAERHTTI